MFTILAMLTVLSVFQVSVFIDCTHIFTLERDFSKLASDKELTTHVQEVLSRLKTFKVAVHPRIRLFYQLLKKAMADYERRTSDTLYNPSTYKKEADNVA